MPTSRYERLSTDQKDEGIQNGEGIELGGNHSEAAVPPSGTKLMQMAVGTLAIILLFLSLSICLTFYQGRVIKSLKFPFTIVSYHLVLKFLLSMCVRYALKVAYGKTHVQLDCKTSVRKMAPTGVASGIDIGFSNWGLELVHISLYTMTKSSTIIFILFFAILLRLEKKSWSLMGIVVMISVGLFIFTYKSTQFNALGFAFLLFASLSSGIRWTFAQFVMQKSKLGLHNPVDMIYHMQPWMILSLLPFVIGFEGQDLVQVFRSLNTYPSYEITKVFLILTFGAVLAFLMEMSEFLVLSRTSSLTLSISGIFKDIFQVVLAVEIDGDQLSLVNVVGLIVCLGGICCHVIHKYSTMTSKFNGKNLEEPVEENLRENTSHAINFHNQTSQNVPLLDNSDTDYSHDLDDANASEVLFDVLNRRDVIQR